MVRLSRWPGLLLLLGLVILSGCSDSNPTDNDSSTPLYPPPPPGQAPMLIGQMGEPEFPNELLDECFDSAVDSSGNVYILEPNRVTVMDREGAFVREWSWSGYGYMAYAIAVGPSGHPYLLMPNRIQRRSPEGSLEKEWAVPTGETGWTSDGLAISPENHVFTMDRPSHILYEYDQDGNFIRSRPLNSFVNHTGLAVDTKNNFYILDGALRTVTCLDVDGGVRWRSDQIFSFSSGDIAVNPNHEVFVCHEHTIVKLNADGSFSNSWALPNWSYCREDPMGICCDSKGNVYVAEICDHQVVEFNSSGSLISKFGLSLNTPGLFNGIHGFGVSRSDCIVTVEGRVADSAYPAVEGGARVQEFSSDLGFIREWGGLGPDPGRFLLPVGVAIDENDEVYVADQRTHRVQRFAWNGTLLDYWDFPNSNLTALAISEKPTRVYVGDREWVRKFTPSGSLIQEWNVAQRAGQTPDWTASVKGIAVQNDRNLVVALELHKCADSLCRYTTYRGTLERFGFEGTYLGRIRDLDVGPTGLACDEWGNIYVSDYQGLKRFGSDGKLEARWGDGSRGVAVTPSGRVLEITGVANWNVRDNRVNVYGY